MMHSYSSALLVDQYQLSMLDSYIRREMHETAVFELFIRRLPPKRNFLIAAGLEQAIEFLETLKFTPTEINTLAQTGYYSEKLLDYLRDFQFTGNVNAMPEGTPFFANEPILQITAPLPMAQFIETRLINIIHFQTMIASKAIRSVLVKPEKTFIDFGLRRAHGYDAGLYAARASYIGGFTGTATVLAGALFNIPTFGTMAHSFIEAHETEELAFLHFAEDQPDNVIFLIDTYDTIQGAKKVCKLAPELSKKGIRIKGVRIDSGDLAKYAHQVREILDQSGLTEVSIVASGNLDEDKITSLLSTNAPIDGFGIGTHLTTSADYPFLDCVYKLQEYNEKPKRKKSENKVTWPGKKQVYRRQGDEGVASSDVIALCNETVTGAIPLLQPVMKAGKRVSSPLSVQDIRKYCLASIKTLPEALKEISPALSNCYPVQISDALQALADEVDLQQSDLNKSI